MNSCSQKSRIRTKVLHSAPLIMEQPQSGPLLIELSIALGFTSSGHLNCGSLTQPQAFPIGLIHRLTALQAASALSCSLLTLLLLSLQQQRLGVPVTAYERDEAMGRKWCHSPNVFHLENKCLNFSLVFIFDKCLGLALLLI